jgi:hypothetical protein
MGLNKCIINAAIGQWYPKGQERLKNSLEGKFDGDLLMFESFPTLGYDETNIYNVKASCLEYAISQGFELILWADCSMYAVKNTQAIFDILETDGFYVETNGMNAAQECSDNCLAYFNVNRNDAEYLPMCSSGLIGVNMKHEKGKLFAEKWIKAAKDGAFAGSRLHDGQSMDFRFKWHRQDQSAASIIANQLGLKMYPLGKFMNYAPSDNQNLIFLCQGMG